MGNKLDKVETGQMTAGELMDFSSAKRGTFWNFGHALPADALGPVSEEVAVQLQQVRAQLAENAARVPDSERAPVVRRVIWPQVALAILGVAITYI